MRGQSKASACIYDPTTGLRPAYTMPHLGFALHIRCHSWASPCLSASSASGNAFPGFALIDMPPADKGLHPETRMRHTLNYEISRLTYSINAADETSTCPETSKSAHPAYGFFTEGVTREYITPMSCVKLALCCTWRGFGFVPNPKYKPRTLCWCFGVVSSMVPLATPKTPGSTLTSASNTAPGLSRFTPPSRIRAAPRGCGVLVKACRRCRKPARRLPTRTRRRICRKCLGRRLPTRTRRRICRQCLGRRLPTRTVRSTEGFWSNSTGTSCRSESTATSSSADCMGTSFSWMFTECSS